MYSYNAFVRYSETGGRFKLPVSGIANYFQDCAILHSERVGAGIEYLKEQKRAWFLVSWQIDIDRYPLLHEDIEVSTWAYMFRGSMGYRNFLIRDLQGETLVKAATIWSYVDTSSMRPTKVDDHMAEAYAPYEPKLDMEYTPRKIAIHDDMTLIAKRQVMPYQIDSNNHMNNEAYLAMAMEYIGSWEDIGRVRAEYKQQFSNGETVYIYYGEWENVRQFAFYSDEGHTLRATAEFYYR